MNKLLAKRALAVGALVAAAIAAFLVIFTFIRKGGYSADESYVVHAYFSDATGLTWKSRAQIAGIQVGEVSKISLEGQKARLELRIKNEVDLKVDACLTKTFPSALLPDALLEVVPGSADQPSLSSLPAGQRVIACVRESTSVQQLIDGMAKIAADVQVVTADIARTVGGNQGSMREIIENLAALTRRLDATVAANEGRLASILENVDVITGDVRELTQGEKERIRLIARNVEALTTQLKGVAGSLQAVMDGTGPAAPGQGSGATGGGAPAGEAAAQARGVKQAVEKANANLARLDDLLAKLQEGKSVGSRLLVDEKMGRQLAETVDAAAGYVEKLDKLQVEVQLRSEWLLNQTGAKTYFGARLLPRPDKYYMFEVVSDPRGVDTVTTETITTRDPVTGTDTTTVSTRTLHEEKLTFTLQMAKRYGPMTFRVGVIESSGGAGTDLHLFDDALQFSVSIYQFSRPYQNVFPRAKVWLNYHFLQHFYLTAGADDFLNVWREGRYPGGPKFTLGNDVFFGGGLYFTDDDLKTLLGAGGGSVVGAVGSSK
ncbi:MAG: MlaD family protein [Anaeromyxobacteraceae bacterium]|nr:MlaD family protein [Anaeromyxobacteraceae bacterium]